MPTPEHMRDAVLKYFASFATADVESILDLFADDALVEDPIGGTRLEGKEALRRFFGGGFEFTGGPYQFVPEGAVRIAGNHAACAAIATCDKADPPFRIETLDVMTFNEAGKFTSMMAYWGPINMQALSGDAAAGAEAASRALNFVKSIES